MKIKFSTFVIGIYDPMDVAFPLGMFRFNEDIFSSGVIVRVYMPIIKKLIF
jgi:hypothetical protein